MKKKMKTLDLVKYANLKRNSTKKIVKWTFLRIDLLQINQINCTLFSRKNCQTRVNFSWFDLTEKMQKWNNLKSAEIRTWFVFQPISRKIPRSSNYLAFCVRIFLPTRKNLIPIFLQFLGLVFLLKNVLRSRPVLF